jgi:hypothetical protein
MNNIKLFESKQVRSAWNDLKTKLKKEGSELSEKIGQLKMQAGDGKFRVTDVADVEQLFVSSSLFHHPKN